MNKQTLYFLGLFSGVSVYDSKEIICGDAMKKILFALLCMALFCLVTGCSAGKISTQKIRDIDFTVVDEHNIPEELEEKIDDKEEKPFKLTYADKGALYIAVGYGKQKTSGYSIKVTDLYETENALYIHTNLIGPAKDEKIVEEETYPYIAIKLEYIDKNVVFE